MKHSAKVMAPMTALFMTSAWRTQAIAQTPPAKGGARPAATQDTDKGAAPYRQHGCAANFDRAFPHCLHSMLRGRARLFI